MDATHTATHRAQSNSTTFALSACVRCRSRKTRCDPGLPRCSACERNNAPCEYFNSAKGKRISRNYVVHLQNKIKSLESEMSQLRSQSSITPDAERMLRSGGLVSLKENAETRYLGPSSGIAMTRLVMEIAKRETQSRSIQEIISDTKVRRIRDRFSLELAKPTSKIYPLVSSVAAPDLPSRDLTEKLVELFNRKAQFMLPTLHEPSFRRVVNNVYNNSTDAYENFVLRIVLAVSMQKLDVTYAGLADSYYLAAMQHLEESVRRKDLGTLQCLALIAQYSMVTPTRAASYWVVGLATKLCQELGLTQEATINNPSPRTSVSPSALQLDMKRRLLWIIFSMETGLAHSLGRSCGFACSHDYIDVKPFKCVDDEYISDEGITPGCPRSMKKLVAVHFLSMRFLQLEIRKKLYLARKPFPKDDQDPWFLAMEQKLRDWMKSSPKQDGGSGLDEVWFKGRFNTMIVFLYRPSPQIPAPSLAAARTCFEACTFNVRMHRNQVATKSVDLSWIWTQSLFMALNTILWAISYPEIRRDHSKAVVENHIMQAQECIVAAAERWPGVEAAMELYEALIGACLKAYEAPSSAPVQIEGRAAEVPPVKLKWNTTQPPGFSPSTTVSSLDSPQTSEYTSSSAPSTSTNYCKHPAVASTSFPITEQGIPSSHYAQYMRNPPQDKPRTSTYNDPVSVSIYQQVPLPALQQPDSLLPQQAPLEYHTPMTNYDQYFAMMGDPYFQHLATPDFHPSPPSLNQEQQGELMRNLESDNVTYGWRFP